MRIYTDGGYRGGVGGWGWWNETTGESNRGSTTPTTNQRMELYAALDAIDFHLDCGDVTIVSDSAYLVNAMRNNWYKRWHMNGWRNVKGEPVANQDLWEGLARYVQENPNIRFEKVKGHSGNPGNERADSLATEAIMEYEEQKNAATERLFRYSTDGVDGGLAASTGVGSESNNSRNNRKDDHLVSDSGGVESQGQSDRDDHTGEGRAEGRASLSVVEKPTNKLPPAPYVLKPHQKIAVEKMSNGCVLAGDVGVGKTFTALSYFVLTVCEGRLDRTRPMRKPKKLIVITTAKKRDELDWHTEAMHLGLFPDPEVSYSGREFIVDSWNNMKKYENEKDAFFIFDEQKLVGKGAWVKSFLNIAWNNEWILLSATPADNWIDYVPLFLAHGFYRNRTEFMNEHVVWKMINGRYPQIRGYYGVKKLRKLRDSLLVDMPYERHTTRHLIAVEVTHDEDLFNRVWKKRWNVYDDVPLLDSGEMHRIGRKVVNSDPSRLDAIEELSRRHDRLIIFYNFDYELEMLRTLHTRLDIKVAEWNGHLHEPVPDGDRWLYLVQYQAGAEGWNCTTTDCIVFYSLTYSHKIFHQSQGRIDRMDTPYEDLWYHILMSRAKIDQLIWRSLTLKKNFHEGRKQKFGKAA